MEGLTTSQKRATFVVLSLLMVSAVAATQFAQTDIGYSFTISGADSGIRFIGHDPAVDGVTMLRADNTAGLNLRMELGDWARGQTVTYTGAFGIVNENLQGINITSVTVTGMGNIHMYLWLHNNADTKATQDAGTLIFDDGNGAQSFSWALAAGNGDASDAGTKDTPLNVESNTRTLNATDNALGTDHAWCQIKLEIPESATNGDFSGTISFTFEESEDPLTLITPNGGQEWEVDTDQNIQWSGGDQTIDNVKLEYSKDNFTSNLNTIVASTPNDGAYQWTIPDDADDSVWVRVSDVSDADRKDTSDDSFTILAVDENLMAYWRFDESSGTTAYDSTDNDNDGTLYNNADFVSNVVISNNSMNLPDGNSQIRVPDDDTLDPATGSYSFEVWFRTESGSEQYILWKRDGWDEGYFLRLKSNYITLRVEDPSTTGVSIDSASSSTYDTGYWTHVVGVVNRDDDKLYLYVNGANSATPKSISSVGTIASDQQLLIGTRSTSDGSYDFDGIIDEVRFYNRVLTSSEIAAKYTEWPTSISLTAPNGGENWTAGDAETIAWNAAGDVDILKLEYSTDNFVSDVNTIDASTDNDGSYSHTVPSISSTTVRYRITDISDGSVTDTSDADLEIYSASSSGNLRHWWKFDEASGTTAYDSEGDTDAYLDNGAKTGSTAKVNYALDLDGSDDVAIVDDDDSLDVGSDESVSFALWLKAGDDDENQYLFYKDGNGYGKYYLKLEDDGDLKFYVRDTNGDRQSSKANDRNYDDGYWYHVVCVLDRSSDMMYIYVDGELEDSDSTSSIGSLASDDELFIGAKDSSGRDEFGGYIDEFRFYDEALDSTEVSDLYDSY